MHKCGCGKPLSKTYSSILKALSEHLHTHTELKAKWTLFSSHIFGPFHFLLGRWADGVLISELGLFKASFLSKQKIIQLMCAIQVFPFADLCISREIKASFVFYRALELKFDAYQLPAFSEGYLQAKKQRKKRQRYRSKSYEA